MKILAISLAAALPTSASLEFGFSRSVSDFNGTTPGLAWGDFDQDGRLELLISGYANSFVFGTERLQLAVAPDGSVSFEEQAAPTTPSSFGPLVVGDFDGDGRLDFALADIWATLPVVRLALNLGGGQFAGRLLPMTDVVQLTTLRRADLDFDGDLDLVVSGLSPTQSGSRAVITVLENDGTAQFQPIPLSDLTPEAAMVVQLEVADFDADGDLDLWASGSRASENSPGHWLLLRQPDGAYARATTSLPVAENSSLLLADFDGDGDMDFAAAEAIDDSAYRPVLLRQDGPGGFTRLPNNLPAQARGPLFWADADADGGLELWIGSEVSALGEKVSATGYPTGPDGAGAVPVTGGGTLPVLISGNAVAADSTGDGRVDFLFSGAVFYSESLTLPGTGFQPGTTNNPINTPPGAPVGLQVAQSNGEIVFEWSPATDANQTNGLTYNLRVGTAPGRGDVLPPHSDPATGWRQIAEPGNAGARHSARLRLPAGDYFWSVQAMDAGLAGGPFAAEGQFNVAESRPSLRRVAAELTQLGSARLSGEVNPGALPADWWFELAGDSPDAPTNVITRSRVAATNVFLPVEGLAAGLAINAPYRAWLVASNPLGLVRSPAVEFYVFNRAPVVSMTNAAFALPGTTLRIPFTVTDPDRAEPNVVLNTAFFPVTGQTHPVAETVIIGEGPNRLLELRLKGDVFGAGNVRVSAVDEGGQGETGVALVRVTADYFQVVQPLRQAGAGVAADLDQDGRPDYFMAGRAQVQLLGADGSLSALLCGLPTEGRENATALARDFDGDGRVDLVRVQERNPRARTQSALLRNTGDWAGLPSGGPVCGLSIISTNLPSANDAVLAAADIDSDGDLDLLVASDGDRNFGIVQFRPVYLLENDGRGGLTTVPNTFPNLAEPIATWGDYDGDGDPDLLLAGLTTNLTRMSVTFTTLYRNEGNFKFTSATNLLPGFSYGAADWADMDNDGDLDLAIAGNTNRSPNSYRPGGLLFRNDAGTLTALTNALFPTFASHLRWADVDHDGRPDLFIGGADLREINQLRLLRQAIDGNFALTGSYVSSPSGTVELADFDADGDLDFLSALNDGQAADFRWNRITVSNTPPGTPSNLRAEVIGNEVVFRWDAATDSQQSGGLTYNLRVGTAPGTQDVVTAMADTSTGRRWIAARGNMDTTLHWVWKRPRPGTYYWSVQAADHSYVGGAFGTEQRLVVADLPPAIVGAALRESASTAAYATGTLLNHGEPTTWWFEWGATLSYGSATAPRTAGGAEAPIILDAALLELPADSALHARLVVSNRFGVAISADIAVTTPAWAPFTPLRTLLPQFGEGRAEWADFDGDDDLDLAVQPFSTNAYPTLFRHDGGWLAGVPLMPGFVQSPSSLHWADWDADGDLDLLARVRPRISGSEPNLLGRNLGNGQLEIVRYHDSSILPERKTLGPFAGGDWQDYDLDGDSDVIQVFSFPVPQVLVSLGRSQFRMTQPLVAVPSPFVYWADLNGDEILDLAGTTQNDTSVWLGLTPGTFASLPARLNGLLNDDSFWHDWDGDGDVDALLTDLVATPDRVRILLNDGNGKFDVDALGGTNLSGMLLGAADLDADGRLDFVTKHENSLFLWTRPNGTEFVSETLSVAGTDNSDFSFADFDRDGRLDFLFTAQRGTTTNRITAVFRNNLPGTNTPPAAPTNLAAAVSTNVVAFAWDAAVDVNQSGGLTYNVYVGTAPGRQDVLAAHSNPTTGYRHQPQPGNNGLRHARRLVNLYPGTYWWSVQAVDSSFAGGVFAPEQSFVIPINSTPLVELSIEMPVETIEARTGLAGWLTVEESDDLASWTGASTNHVQAGTFQLLNILPTGGTQRFLRGRLEPR